MLQSLILGNAVVSVIIMKLNQARKCKKTSTNYEISVNLPRVLGSAYEFALHALNDPEIRSTANSNNYME